MALKNDRVWEPPKVNSPERDKMPKDAFLLPEQRKYPYKKQVDGKWVISCAGLRSAYIVANLRGDTEIRDKALRIAKQVGCKWVNGK